MFSTSYRLNLSVPIHSRFVASPERRTDDPTEARSSAGACRVRNRFMASSIQV